MPTRITTQSTTQVAITDIPDGTWVLSSAYEYVPPVNGVYVALGLDSKISTSYTPFINTASPIDIETDQGYSPQIICTEYVSTIERQDLPLSLVSAPSCDGCEDLEYVQVKPE